MNNQAIQRNGADAATWSIMERVLIAGDLAKLTPDERLDYYRHVCESVGLNPLTRPFDYITLNGKLTLYARKDAADQLRERRGVSVYRIERDVLNGAYIVTAYARMPDGREDSDIGAVPIDKLQGDTLCNAMMKATTKAKRRVTLSICGLGFLDETEVETIASARPVRVNAETGEILTVAPTEIREEQPPANRPQDNASAPVESRAGAQGRTAPPTNGAASPSRAQEGNTHETGDLASAWKEYRYLAPQAGYTTAEAQKAHIQEVYPGRKPRDLTLAEVGVLVAICRSILDLPANDGAEAVA